MKPSLPFPRSPAEAWSHRLRWPLACALGFALSGASLALLVHSPLLQAPPVQRLLAALRAAPPATPVPTSPRPPASESSVEPQAAPPAASHRPAPAILRRDEPAPPLPAATGLATTKAEDGAAAPGVDPPALPGATAPSIGGGAATATRSVSPRSATDIACPQQPKPRFPKTALDDGLGGGEVVARFHLDEQGLVRLVEIVQEQPPGYFAAAVRAAARGWRCDGGRGDSVLVRFPFVVADR